MKKQLFFLFMLAVSFSYAKMVDAIALVVEGEPITTAEIKAVEQQTGVGKSDRPAHSGQAPKSGDETHYRS